MEDRIIMFTEEEAIDYKTGAKKDKSSVIANIRRQRQNNQILSYEIKELVRTVQFTIQYKNKTREKIEIPKNDYYRIVLKTILTTKEKTYDEITYVIKGGYKEVESDGLKFFAPWETIVTEPEKDEKKVKSPIEIVEYVKCMYQNGEISSFHKRGTDRLEYEIITTDDEKIRILTPCGNKVVPILDDILKVYQQKNSKIHLESVKGKLKPVCKVAAIISACALVVTNPYTDKVIKVAVNTIEKSIEKMNLEEEIQSNLLIMSSYYTRLKMDGILSNEEYDHFVSLINETKDYYEQNQKTDSIDYELILDYQELADSKYQSIRSAHY